MLNKFEKIVENNAEKIAYKINNEKITYQNLWQSANKLAKSLKAQGESPVILYGHKSINMVISIIACLMAKRAYVPIDLHTPMDRIYKIIKLTNSKLVIKNEDIKLNEIECLTVDEINEKYFNCDENNIAKNEIAYIIFTSGSTGEPKGVPISYNNLNNFINWISNIESLNSYKNINVMNQASFSFDLSVADFYYALFNGHTLVGLDKNVSRNYDKMFEIIENENINLLVITPTFIKMLLLNSEFNEKNYSSLQCMYFCGEQLEVSTVRKIKERFENMVIINAYGPTEATSAVSAITIKDEMLDNEYLPVGRLTTAATDISILEDEIILKGNSVFGGYIGNLKGGHYLEKGCNCYKTGDIGYIENDLLYCKGRKDNQIKYKGYRIELGDIENNLLKIAGVKEAVVIAKSNINNQVIKLIKAYITLEKEIEIDMIKSELKKLLPEYMIPKNIVILEKIPVNENGKYDRKKLKEL